MTYTVAVLVLVLVIMLVEVSVIVIIEVLVSVRVWVLTDVMVMVAGTAGGHVAALADGIQPAGQERAAWAEARAARARMAGAYCILMVI